MRVQWPWAGGTAEQGSPCTLGTLVWPSWLATVYHVSAGLPQVSAGLYCCMLISPGALWVGLWLVPMAVLEVCQFSRDASVAEAWLIAQEPYLASRDFGHTVDSVEKLIKRHEAFEKSTASWAERFAALEKPTTVSWG